MKNDITRGMGSLKQYIEEIEKQFGSLRAAGRELGIDYQRLAGWKNSGKTLQKFLDFLEESRKKTKKTKVELWDTIISKKKKS